MREERASNGAGGDGDDAASYHEQADVHLQWSKLFRALVADVVEHADSNVDAGIMPGGEAGTAGAVAGGMWRLDKGVTGQPGKGGLLSVDSLMDTLGTSIKREIQAWKAEGGGGGGPQDDAEATAGTAASSALVMGPTTADETHFAALSVGAWLHLEACLDSDATDLLAARIAEACAHWWTGRLPPIPHDLVFSAEEDNGEAGGNYGDDQRVGSAGEQEGDGTEVHGDGKKQSGSAAPRLPDDVLALFEADGEDAMLTVLRVALCSKFPGMANDGLWAVFSAINDANNKKSRSSEAADATCDVEGAPPPHVTVGRQSGGLPTFYVHTHARIAAAGICQRLGLPVSCARVVPCNGFVGSPYAMDMAALEAMMDDDAAAGHVPFAVFLQAGILAVQHADDIARAISIARPRRVWTHVSGPSTVLLLAASSSLNSPPPPSHHARSPNLSNPHQPGEATFTAASRSMAVTEVPPELLAIRGTDSFTMETQGLLFGTQSETVSPLCSFFTRPIPPSVPLNQLPLPSLFAMLLRLHWAGPPGPLLLDAGSAEHGSISVSQDSSNHNNDNDNGNGNVNDNNNAAVSHLQQQQTLGSTTWQLAVSLEASLQRVLEEGRALATLVDDGYGDVAVRLFADATAPHVVCFSYKPPADSWLPVDQLIAMANARTLAAFEQDDEEDDDDDDEEDNDASNSRQGQGRGQDDQHLLQSQQEEGVVSRGVHHDGRQQRSRRHVPAGVYFVPGEDASDAAGSDEANSQNAMGAVDGAACLVCFDPLNLPFKPRTHAEAARRAAHLDNFFRSLLDSYVAVTDVERDAKLFVAMASAEAQRTGGLIEPVVISQKLPSTSSLNGKGVATAGGLYFLGGDGEPFTGVGCLRFNPTYLDKLAEDFLTDSSAMSAELTSFHHAVIDSLVAEDPHLFVPVAVVDSETGPGEQEEEMSATTAAEKNNKPASSELCVGIVSLPSSGGVDDADGDKRDQQLVLGITAVLAKAKAACEAEEARKFLETLGHTVKHVIGVAEQRLNQSKDDAAYQEGVIRQVPILGSIVDFIAPPASKSPIQGWQWEIPTDILNDKATPTTQNEDVVDDDDAGTSTDQDDEGEEGGVQNEYTTLPPPLPDSTL